MRVRLDPLGPADDVAQGTLAASLVSARLASRRWAMREKLGIEDAESVEDEILLDELIDAPEVRAAIVRGGAGRGGIAACDSDGGDQCRDLRHSLPRVVAGAGAAAHPGVGAAHPEPTAGQPEPLGSMRQSAHYPGSPRHAWSLRRSARGREPHPTHQSPQPGAIRAVHPAASARRRLPQATATTKDTRMTLPQPASAKTFADRLTHLADAHLEQTLSDRPGPRPHWRALGHGTRRPLRLRTRPPPAARTPSSTSSQELRTRTAPAS